MREGEPHGGWVMALLLTAFQQALLTSEDAVLSDELNHASIIDGIRLCKAHKYRYRHLDMADLEAKLQEAQVRQGLAHPGPRFYPQPPLQTAPFPSEGKEACRSHLLTHRQIA